MKFNQQSEDFKPITITLESEQEVAELYKFINAVNLPRVGAVRDIFEYLFSEKIGMSSAKANTILKEG